MMAFADVFYFYLWAFAYLFFKSFSVEREPHDNSSNYPEEPWRITEEQREYYINQFRSLQPDPSSFISGN